MCVCYVGLGPSRSINNECVCEAVLWTGRAINLCMRGRPGAGLRPGMKWLVRVGVIRAGTTIGVVLALNPLVEGVYSICLCL